MVHHLSPSALEREQFSRIQQSFYLGVAQPLPMQVARSIEAASCYLQRLIEQHPSARCNFSLTSGLCILEPQQNRCTANVDTFPLKRRKI